MTGRGTYLIGPNQAYRSLAEGLAALQADQGTTPFTQAQELVIVEPGTYEGLRIEAGSLTPTSTARLWIRGATGVRPVITESENLGSIGVQVGNNVPYVGLQSLRFASLTNAVVFGANSHRGIVDKCDFRNAGRNTAIWFYQADECQVSNSLVVNARHAVAAQQVKSVALLQNTLYNAEGSESEPTYLVYLDLQDGDPGLAYLYNNIFFSRGSYGLLCYRDQLAYLRSDYNNWYFPAAEVLPSQKVLSALVEQRERLDTGVTRSFAVRLKPINPQSAGDQLAWQFLSNQDGNSRAQDPALLQNPNQGSQTTPSPVGAPTSYAMVTAGAAPLCGDLLDLLPSWADATLLCKDIDGDSRGTTTSFGAYEVYTNASYDVDDAFADPEPADCNPQDPIDVVADRYQASVPTWSPKVHRGHFFSRDMGYHLFSQKRGVYLRDTYRTTFALSCLLDSVEQILVSGEDVTSTATWEIDGYTFVVHHYGLDTSDTDVLVRGTTKEWDDTNQAFVYRTVEHRWNADDGMRSYVLPSNPKPGHPIVVTDDLLAPTDSLDMAQEFRTVYDPVRDQTSVEFGGAKNLWANPDFAYTDTGVARITDVFTGSVNTYLPEEYELYQGGNLGVAGRFGAGSNHPENLPLRAGKDLLVGPGTSWVGQRIKVDPDQPYVFSAYGCSLSTTETGEVRATVEFFDWDNQSLGSYGPYATYLDPATGSPTWKRFGFQLAATADSTPGRPPLSTRMEVISERVPIPSSASRAFLRLHRGQGEGHVALDAIQFEQGYQPTAFTRIPRGYDLTIEYEEGDSRFYEVKDLNLQPMRHGFNSGFLSILPVPARHWDADAPEFATTLSDYRWPWGRINLLPWARTDGFSKYHRRVWFSTHDRREPRDGVAVGAEVAYPTRIRTNPALIEAVQGSVGTLFAVEVHDEEDNPYAFGPIRATISDATGEFPGYLNRTEWGYPVELGQTVRTHLNEAGMQVFRWIPPDDVAYRGDKPTIQTSTGGYGYGYVRTRYRPYRENHGGVVLQDQYGTGVGLEGDPVTGAFLGRYHSDGLTRVRLPRFPVEGSVAVYVSDTGTHDLRLLEQHYPPLFDKHFHVDYRTGTISVSGVWEQMIKVAYKPRLAWMDPAYERRIYLDKRALDQATGDIAVHYDALLEVHVEALSPEGQTYRTPIHKKVDAVAQHDQRSVQWP